VLRNGRQTRGGSLPLLAALLQGLRGGDLLGQGQLAGRRRGLQEDTKPEALPLDAHGVEGEPERQQSQVERVK